jgi:hypothetical protein
LVVVTEVPWFPHSLREHVGSAAELRGRWCYVVVEEVLDRTALLQQWPWPLADEKGRLFWPPEDHEAMRDAAVTLSTVERRLYRPHRVHRHPRVGDTFAVLGADGPGWDSEVLVDEVRDLFPGLVLDVSAEARAAARLAYEGSLVRPVSEEQVDPSQVRKAAAKRQGITSRALLESAGTVQPDDRNGVRS